jgi:hypothetical protein
MAGTHFDYPALVRKALLGVVRDVLTHTAEHGLPEEHYFYLTFRTLHPGVEIPASRRAAHPTEMTIVLQNQFWNLGVEEERFSVGLRFGGKLERLLIPFDALVAFSDPSVPIELRFAQAEPEVRAEEQDSSSRTSAEAKPPSGAAVLPFRAPHPPDTDPAGS